MRIPLGAQASLPACFPPEQAGKDACAPRDFLRRRIMMRILFSILLIGLLSPPTLAQATASKIDEISGNWIFSVQFSQDTETHSTNLQVADNKFTGSIGPRKIAGSISDSVVTIKILN